LRPSMRLVLEEIRLMEARIGELERQLSQLAKASPACQVLQSVPGIGLLTSTAMVAAVADPGSFASGRRYSSFLGLTPREYSSGNTRYLARTSKRGDRYIRMLLTHGARSILRAATVARRAGRQIDRLKIWALAVQARTNHNKAACALANKLARIAWAVWVKHERYRAEPAPATPSLWRLKLKISHRGLRRETPPIMATTVGPARAKADNSADRCSIAQNVWLPVRRFHVGTSAMTLTPDAGYTTATDSRVDLLTAFLLYRGSSPYTRG